MRSVQVVRLDGPSGVEVVEAPSHRAARARCSSRCTRSGVSWPDLLQSRGEYQIKPELPFQLGVDFAGVVREAPDGSGLDRRRPGRLLPAVRRRRGPGRACTADSVFPLPDGVELREGRRAADELPHRPVRPGRPGPGSARARRCWSTVPPAGSAPPRSRWPAGYGARTIAVVSTAGEGRLRPGRSAPTRRCSSTASWPAVKELTDGRGVDVVVDVVGGDLMTDSLRALGTAGPAAGGRASPAAASRRCRVNRLLLNNIDVRGVGWGAYAMARPGFMRGQWDALLPMIESGVVDPPVGDDVPARRGAAGR